MTRADLSMQASDAWFMSAAVLKSLTDKNRLSPVLAGHALIDGDRMIVRLPEGEVSVQAKKTLFRQVHKWCNGSRTWEEILNCVSEDVRCEFDQFIEFLLANRALIDANLLTASSASWGYQSSTVGVAASDDVSIQIAQRFGGNNLGAAEGIPSSKLDESSCPLDALLEQRVSTRTFADQTLTTTQLHPLLWTLGGVVHSEHPVNGNFGPHRTIGSGGGMYLVRWYVALVRQVGDYIPGVYRIDYPGERQVRLVRLDSDIRLFHRVFVRPWQQSYVTGAVFGIGHAQIGALRYRNRALQLQYLEAGAAVQNFSLKAPMLGVASCILGGYDEAHVKRLCQLSSEPGQMSGHEMVLTSIIFGSQPTKEDHTLQGRMMPIDFIWGDTDGATYKLPFHLARARLKDKKGEEYSTWGKDYDPWIAYIKAHVETIERQGMREPRNVSVGTIVEMAGAIDPHALVRYSDSQYRSPGFLHRPFDLHATYHWVPAVDINTGSTHQVLGEFVYGSYLNNNIKVTGNSYTESSSSGCAAGRTLDEAVLAGLLEVIERDAFMRHWLTQQPGLRLDIKLLPQDLQQRIRTMEQAGCIVTVQKLHSAAAEVILTSATHEGKHFTCVSAAARLNISQAAHAALDELDAMVYIRLLGNNFAALNPKDVVSPANHASLYAQKRYYRRADAVLQPVAAYDPTKIERTSSNAAPLAQLLQELMAKGFQALYVDITPARAFVDQGRTPISVIKAIVPNLIPISFGYAREPRGMLTPVHRASHFPHPFP